MPLRAVFLDVGNTLVRERPSRFEIYALCARQHGLEVSTERMQQLMRAAHRDLPREIAGAWRYTERWFEAYIERIADPATFELFPGAMELCEELRARALVVGLVSNWSVRLPRLVEQLGLS